MNEMVFVRTRSIREHISRKTKIASDIALKFLMIIGVREEIIRKGVPPAISARK